MNTYVAHGGNGAVLLFSSQRRLHWTVLFAFVVSLVFAVHGPALAAGNQLKVLAIGNSFSQDGVQLLHHIARDAGIESVVVGNMYIAGASLATHWSNAQANAPAYLYEKNVSGTWQSRANTTLLEALQDEDWDVITLQQASGLSGVASSFIAADRLQNLVNYVVQHKTNADAKLAWHLTWAYQSDSTHDSFATYGRNQMTMYTSIVSAVQEHIVPNDAFNVIIPAGTAIQNARTSYIGDTLTRDGYHLNVYLGRYIAGLTWLHALGWPIDHVTYVPSKVEVPEAYLPTIREAVHAAVAQPFSVTDLGHIQKPAAISAIATRANVPDGYTLLDWEPVGCAYWNSTDASGQSTVLIGQHNSSASNLCYFASSARMFTRADVPVGSIIEIERGFQYRPEGWVDLATQGSRPAPVTENDIVVTEAWWGDYTYRAFNVSFEGGNVDISSFVDNVVSRFRIYVPE